MKFIKILSLLLLSFLFVGCQEVPTYTTQEILDALEIEYQEGDDQEHVTGNMVFPLESSLDPEIKISWVTDQPSIIDYFGTVNQPENDTLVEATFTVDNYGSKFSQVMTFNVIGTYQVVESSYTINYYYQNIEDDLYTLDDSDVISSEVGKNIVLNPDVEIGFELNAQKSILTGTVVENDALVIDVYYDRNIYEVELFDGSTLLETIEVKHGDLIALDNPEKTGFTFIEWRKQGTTTEFNFNEAIQSDLVLNAIFRDLTDDQVYTGYYEGATGLYGDDLITLLHNIINTGFDGVTYGDARYMLDDTDQDPDDVDNVILVYLGTSVSGVWDSGATWNREHVWPQSFLGESASNGTTNSASDLHNLKPSDPGENSSRSNKYFGNETNELTYEPRDEVKGDIARILFYMDIMYNDLSLIEANEGDVYEMGNLSVLLEWHELDPVDDFETYRNDKIYEYQKNRNPFIDHPEFVDKIYGDDWTQTTFDSPYHVFTNMIVEHDGV